MTSISTLCIKQWGVLPGACGLRGCVLTVGQRTSQAQQPCAPAPCAGYVYAGAYQQLCVCCRRAGAPTPRSSYGMARRTPSRTCQAYHVAVLFLLQGNGFYRAALEPPRSSPRAHPAPQP